MCARRMTFGLTSELREVQLHVYDPDACSRLPILLVGIALALSSASCAKVRSWPSNARQSTQSTPKAPKCQHIGGVEVVRQVSVRP